MKLGDGIRKHGFLRWHERVLMTSFAWLVLTLLSAIAAFAALEALFNSERWLDHARSAFVIVAAGAVGVVALHRFLSGLLRAQQAAGRAICSQCETFGRLAVVVTDREATWVRVRCRKCGHEWVMDDP